MHPAILFTARYGPEIASWILDHRDQIPETFHRISAPVFHSITGRSHAVDRIGATLVALQSDGQREVIGLLHRQGGQLDDIGRSVDGVADAVSGVADAQHGLADALGSLTSYSVVTLGFSILTPLLLIGQFAYLNKRLKELSRAMKAIQNHLDIDAIAHLDAGLTQLDAASHGGHEQAEALNAANVALTKSPSAVFKRTVGAGSSPTRYLMPAMREHGVTLESMAELYRQAGLAGVREETRRKTASEFFEELRGSLANASDPKFRTSTAATARARTSTWRRNAGRCCTRR